MSRSTVLLKDEVVRRHVVAVFDQFRQKIVCIVVGINLGLFCDEVNTSFASITHSGRHRHTGGKLGPLHEEPLLTDIALLTSSPNAIILAVQRRTDVKKT